MAKPTAEQQAAILDASRRGKAHGLFFVRAGLDFDARTNGMVWVSMSVEDMVILLDKADRLDAIEASKREANDEAQRIADETIEHIYGVTF